MAVNCVWSAHDHQEHQSRRRDPGRHHHRLRSAPGDAARRQTGADRRPERTHAHVRRACRRHPARGDGAGAGLPKGVMLTHRNLVANLCQCQGMENWECFGEGDTVLAALPYFHIYGMVVIMKLGLANGATIVSVPRFDFQEFLGIVQKYKLTVLPLVPPIVLGMVKSPVVDQFDLSSVRLVFSGAAPLGEDLARALSKKLGCPVTQGYGMTEASPVTHLSPTRNMTLKPGSAGRVVPNTEVKLVDPVTGEPVGASNKEGELLMRGPQI